MTGRCGVSGYPYDDYDGTDASFETLQDQQPYAEVHAPDGEELAPGAPGANLDQLAREVHGYLTEYLGKGHERIVADYRLTAGQLFEAGPPVSCARVILYAAGLGWREVPTLTEWVDYLGDIITPAERAEYLTGITDPGATGVDLAREIAAGQPHTDRQFDAICDWWEPAATWWLNHNRAPAGMTFGWRDLAYYLADDDFWGPSGPDEM